LFLLARGVYGILGERLILLGPSSGFSEIPILMENITFEKALLVFKIV
jgi:hypothetical protein